jgi:hypothetical protein
VSNYKKIKHFNVGNTFHPSVEIIKVSQSKRNWSCYNVDTVRTTHRYPSWFDIIQFHITNKILIFSSRDRDLHLLEVGWGLSERDVFPSRISCPNPAESNGKMSNLP